MTTKNDSEISFCRTRWYATPNPQLINHKQLKFATNLRTTSQSITYPLTAYSVDTEYGTGAVKEIILQAPHNYDTHVIKFNKLIWHLSNGQSQVLYIKKKNAKKAGLKLTRSRIKALNREIVELKKIIKETLKKWTI